MEENDAVDKVPRWTKSELGIAALISVVALVFAVAHLLFPATVVDSVTVGLLVMLVAAVPPRRSRAYQLHLSWHGLMCSVLAGLSAVLTLAPTVVAQTDDTAPAPAEVNVPQQSGPDDSPLTRKDIPFGGLAAGLVVEVAPARVIPCPPPDAPAPILPDLSMLDDEYLLFPDWATDPSVTRPDGVQVGQELQLVQGGEPDTSFASAACPWRTWTWHSRLSDPFGAYVASAEDGEQSFEETFLLAPRPTGNVRVVALERVGPPGTRFVWQLAGLASSQPVAVDLFQSWNQCVGPRASLPPVVPNTLGEAIYSVPTAPDDDPGNFIIATRTGTSLMSIELTNPSPVSAEAQVLSALERASCIWGVAAAADHGGQAPGISPDALDNPSDVTTGLTPLPPDKLVGLAFGGQRQAQLLARLHDLSAQNRWEEVLATREPTVHSVRPIDSGKLEALVGEDRVDRVHNADNSVVADLSGHSEERVVLEPAPDIAGLRIVELSGGP